MRRTSLSLLASFVLLGSLLVPAGSRAAGEPHPLIRRAVNALQAAKGDLQNAAHDYCGHRVDALAATNAALTQLQQALACDSSKGPKRRGNSTATEIEAPAEPAGAAGGEPHPRIYNAINALGAAEGDLQNGAHDYCGHRVEALQAVQTALAQLKAAIQCDKK
ncbi:MAG TPA: hypothetical protein VN345_16350 [Blastocatellia bacterium]|nr:hypothetical protein [Blastocatellia bacterium]